MNINHNMSNDLPKTITNIVLFIYKETLHKYLETNNITVNGRGPNKRRGKFFYIEKEQELKKFIRNTARKISRL